MANAANEKLDKNNFDVVFRHLHTLKGNARGFGMTLLSELIHRSESNLEYIKNEFEKFDEERRVQISNELSQVRELLDYFIKIAEEVFSITLDDSKGEVLYQEVHRDNLTSLEDSLKKAMGDSPSSELKDVFLKWYEVF